MTTLSYSTNGLTNLDLFTAIDQLDNAGYGGIEITFQKNYFDPFSLTPEQILKIHTYFQTKTIRPVCISTPTMCFLGPKAHEPSVISLNEHERLRRVELIQKGVLIAKKLHTDMVHTGVVTFGSGFIREEHVKHPWIDPMDLLCDSIKRILHTIGDAPITLVIEPEPGMFIEKLNDAIALVKLVNSPHFKLHLDLCHVFCTEQDYLAAIERGIPYTKYFHISDASQGYNLKIVTHESTLTYPINSEAYMVYFQKFDCFLMMDANKSFCFYNNTLSEEMKNELQIFIQTVQARPLTQWIEYTNLISSPKNEDEIYTYLNSIPKLSFKILDKVKPILHYLRNSTPPIIDKMLANTLTGKVHFHDIPGNGEIDFEGFFNILKKHHFTGATTLELYHHVDDWKNAMVLSMDHLQKYL